MGIKKRKGVARKESVKYYNDQLPTFKDHMKKVVDDVSAKHMYPVPPDPVLIRLDKIIELLEALVKK